MTLASMLTKPAKIVYSSPGGKDQYGQPVYRETSVDTVCYYRLQTTVIGDSVYQTEEQIKVYLPADTKAEGITAVQIDATKYEPAGVPHYQWNPRTETNQYLMLSVRKAKS